ncbi:MAG: GNAT family N-acetyltransferase, partial [Vulcanimicrobiaceae bacterium]
MAEPEAIEIATARPDELVDFWRANEREALTEHWRFRVIWHEQAHEFTARSGSTLAGALRLRIAASLAHVELLFVGLHYRRSGVGRGLLARAEETANYY